MLIGTQVARLAGIGMRLFVDMKKDSLIDEYWLIRPSVSFIPLNDGIVQFFQSSTRRSSYFRLRPEMANVIKSLNGKKSIHELCVCHGAPEVQMKGLINLLHERCFIEPKSIRAAIDGSAFYRVLNFLGDYFPADELSASFERLSSVHIAIFGCGAVGSSIAIQLTHSGIRNFTLIDSDIVEESNLNRAFFSPNDIGVTKVRALASTLEKISSNIRVCEVHKTISKSTMLSKTLNASEIGMVVNCADEPSVDVTSEWVNDYCLEAGVPYVIAGGYNLHLSLIGMTVIPGVSACFNCSRITLNELEDESLRGVRRLWRPKRNLGSLAPLTGITSALATLEVIRLAVKSERLLPAMLNCRGEFNFLTNEISFVELPRRNECRCVS